MTPTITQYLDVSVPTMAILITVELYVMKARTRSVHLLIQFVHLPTNANNAKARATMTLNVRAT